MWKYWKPNKEWQTTILSEKSLCKKYDHTLPDIKNKPTMDHLDDGGGILYIEAEKYLSLSKSIKWTKATEGI